MESNGESSGVFNHNPRTENFNPNVANPGLKASSSPSIRKSAMKIQKLVSKSTRVNPTPVASPATQKSASKIPGLNPTPMASPPTQKSASKNHSLNPTPVASPSPHKKIRQRKFVVAKRNSKREIAETCATASVACKCNKGGGEYKCLCVAYESLRTSQDEFFKNRRAIVDEESALEGLKMYDGIEVGSKEGEEKNNKLVIRDVKSADGCMEKVESDNCFRINGSEKQGPDEHEMCGEMGVSIIKRSRERLLEEAREKVAEPRSGRVLHLVKAFEKLLSPAKSNDAEDNDEKTVVEDSKDRMKRALPGPKVPKTQVSASSFSPPDFPLTYESLGLDSRCSSSLNSSQGSISRRTSAGDRSRRKSAGSAGTSVRRHLKRRQIKTTSDEPFKLRTEQRGKCKKEIFFKKVKQMMEEEEKLRIPIAQGLPWTTDEPERLVKPPVKESTVSIDLVLHSDVRAVGRAEFDHQVAEKLNFIEQYKAERERQQKLAEEEEIRRLRKELVPKAQPMPYFDRPFIPQRSEKLPTTPKERKPHIPHHHKIKS